MVNRISDTIKKKNLRYSKVVYDNENKLYVKTNFTYKVMDLNSSLTLLSLWNNVGNFLGPKTFYIN